MTAIEGGLAPGEIECSRGLRCTHDYTCKNHRALTAVLAAQRERYIKFACRQCAAGEPVERHDFTLTFRGDMALVKWAHPTPSGWYVACDADQLREDATRGEDHA